MKHLFAIDPGPSESAWVRYQPSIVEAPGHIIAFGIEANKKVEATIAHGLDAEHWIVVCEDMGDMGGSVGVETFVTAEQIGRFGLWSEMSGIAFEKMQRNKMKEYILGARTGKDPQIRQELCRMFQVPPGAKKPSEMGPLRGIATHMWAALAVAVAWDVRELIRRRAAKG